MSTFLGHVEPTRDDLDAGTITAFPSYLENERGNIVRIRNARLTAIDSFLHYAALKAPESAQQIARVLSSPTSATSRRSSAS